MRMFLQNTSLTTFEKKKERARGHRTPVSRRRTTVVLYYFVPSFSSYREMIKMRMFLRNTSLTSFKKKKERGLFSPLSLKSITDDSNTFRFFEIQFDFYKMVIQPLIKQFFKSRIIY